MTSKVIYRGSYYTARETQDGALVVTRNRTQEDRRIAGPIVPEWIKTIKTAPDCREANAICRGIFQL